MTIRNQIIRITLSVMLGVTVLLVVTLGILSYYAQKKAEEVLQSSNAKVSSIRVNLLTRSVVANDLVWTYSADSLSGLPHHFQAQVIQIKGISLYQLFLRVVGVTQFIHKSIVQCSGLSHGSSSPLQQNESVLVVWSD